jgi:predicted Zn-dependent protease
MVLKMKGLQWRIVGILTAALFLLHGCEGFLLAPIAHASLSVEKEKEMGKRLVLQIERQLEIIRDPTVQQFLERIGERIVSHSGHAPYDFRFYVVKSPDPNAFAIPGGHVFLASGLIIMASSEDEIAGVVGHEIAHIKARHIAKRIERSRKLSLLSLAGILAGVIMGGKATGAMTATSLAAGQALALKYSRDDEKEADQLGFGYLTEAGYDGWGLVTFLKKMHQTSFQPSGTPPSYLSTHPGTEERISYLLEKLRDSSPRARDGEEKELKRVQAKLFVEERRPQTAVEYFQSILKGNPNDLDAIYGLALGFKKMGRIDLAIGELERARGLAPRDGDIARDLGICYFSRGMLAEAVSVLRESQAINRGDILSLYYMGRAYQEKGDLDAALEAYLKAKSMSTEVVDLYYSLGMVYGKKGDVCKSHRNFSIYFDKTGEFKRALDHLKQASRYCAEQDEIKVEISRMEKLLKEEAEDH